MTIDFSALLVGTICGKVRLISRIASRTKSCMVLTPSMVTTNKIQGDEPRTTALEIQIQALAAAVEHLTKQNYDLEEQLHQKNTGHNTQEKDQKALALKEETKRGRKVAIPLAGQNDMSRPSVTDMALPHIVIEMQMMREWMDLMMNALRGQVSSNLDDLVHQTDSPFTTSINSFPLLPKFCMPQTESYDGAKDPLDHLESFKTLIHLQGVADEIMCRAFPTTLKRLARIWFNRLTPNSIDTFNELSAQFASHFIGRHRYKKSTVCLMSIKEWEDETLRSYIAHFNKEALSNDEADYKILVATFINGLRKGKFLFSLYKNDAKNMSDVLYRATKYMNMEDALLA